MFNVQQNNFQERSIESQVVSDYSDYREVSALYYNVSVTINPIR